MGAHPLGAARRPAANARLRFLMSFAGAATLGLGCGPAAAQQVKSGLWVTDGSVNAIVRNGNTVYIGGSFTQVGPSTGGGVPSRPSSKGRRSSARARGLPMSAGAGTV